MERVFLQEQKRYTEDIIFEKLKISRDKGISIIRRLKEHGVLKAVKKNSKQKTLSWLLEEDIEMIDAKEAEDNVYYVFTFVGVIIVENIVLYCYPKYLDEEDASLAEMKNIIKVIQKDKRQSQEIHMYHMLEDEGTNNKLALSLYLLRDYSDNGIYSKRTEVIENNGEGEILWDKTVNDRIPYIYNNAPYYSELITKRYERTDESFLTRIHRSILTECSNDLGEELLELFDYPFVLLTDERIEEIGDKDYVLDRLSKEINIQFDTRKQRLLRAMYAYLIDERSINDVDSVNLYGTNSFNLTWERICATILDNKLEASLNLLETQLPISILEEYNKGSTLKEIIDHPIWLGKRSDETLFSKRADRTLEPDIISIYKANGEYRFVIFDAKYYRLQLEEGKPLEGQPGVESVTKQYLYHLAYRRFLEDHGITYVCNCFLLPTREEKIIKTGYATMKFLMDMGIPSIQIRLLPARKVFELFLKNEKMRIEDLELEKSC